MRILGIDPGTAITGYGIIDAEGQSLNKISYGSITTPSKQKLSDRLLTINNSLEELIITYEPDEVAVEKLFFNKNTRTALSVGHARGVILLAAARKCLEIGEYTPLQVKQAVAGNGRAAKEQVQFMVRALFSLKEIPSPDDVADALAVAACHAFRWTGAEALRR